MTKQLTPEQQFKIFWRMQQILNKKQTNVTRFNGQSNLIYLAGKIVGASWNKKIYRFNVLITHYFNPQNQQ